MGALQEPPLPGRERGEPAGVPNEAERASHARMLARLAAIAEKTEENPYLGSASIARLQEELVLAPKGSAREASLRFELAQGLLRVGRTEGALAELEACRGIVLALPERERPDFAPRLAFELGVACLRLAENRNCVARHGDESCVFPLRGGGLHVDREGSEKALGWLREALRSARPGEPAEVAARWLLNVAHMTLGTWPDGLSAEERIDASVLASEVPFPRVPEVAGEAGVAGFNLAGGAASEDYDGDGWLDLLISDWDPRSQVRFLHNTGRGRFEERTEGSGLEGIGGALNVTHGDYDGDGRVDLLMLRGAWWNEHGRHPNSLLRNLGGGRWVDVTYLAGLADPAAPTQVGCFADYDLDGDLDLFVANETSPQVSVPSQLFRNEGDGTFTDVAGAAGVANDRYAKGAAWGDYDGDRYPDLYVSNLGARNRLYHNRGDGSFVNVAGKLGVAWPKDSFAVWFWDYDNDGALDLYVTSYYQSLTYRLAPVAASYLGLAHGAEPAALYRNDGRGGFEDATERAHLARISLPMGCNFGDLDNDGFPDFYLGTGYPGFEGLVPNVMYWNRHGETFADVSEAGRFGHLQKGHGVVFADLDNDGDQDLFEEMGGAYPGDGFRNLLFANPGFGNHWLRVTLVGKASARCAIGARIRAEFSEEDVRRSVFRHVSSGGSFGANPLTQHLGLGRAARVDRLEVFWPRTGRTQIFRDVPADRHIAIEEGSDAYRVVPESAFSLGGE